jgi:hypothetical protein
MIKLTFTVKSSGRVVVVEEYKQAVDVLPSLVKVKSDVKQQ